MKFSYRDFLLVLSVTVFVILQGSCSFAQIKLFEDFSGSQFPPSGWSVHNLQGYGSAWGSSPKYCRSGEGCAASEFDTTFGSSFLVTKRFIPSADDSVVFYLRQTFYRVYSDTLKLYLSTADSLPSSMNTLLFTARDGSNYPQHQMYGRYAVSLRQFAGSAVWIGFKHVNSNGEILRIDDVRVGEKLQNDIAVSRIISPSNVIGLCSLDSLIPSAEVSNTGLNSQQSEFTVTCRIEGPVNFVRTITMQLSEDESRVVTFPSVSFSEPGEYVVRVYSGLTNDQFRNNDTLTGSFSVRQYSSGNGDGGYFYASSASCRESQDFRPEYCWKDNSGSNVLLKDGQDNSGGLLHGDLDNGYFAIGDFLPARKELKFFGERYDSIYISLNGMIAFRKSQLLDIAEPGELSNMMDASGSVVAPLWMDFDNSLPGIKNEISYKISGNFLIITFDRMHAKGGDSLSYATFQVSINIGSPTEVGEILFQYNSARTGAGLKEKFSNYSEGNCFTGLLSGYEKLVYRHSYNANTLEAGPLYKGDLAIEIGTVPELLTSKCSMLELNVFLEGFIQKSDTIVVGLHDYNFPGTTIESVKAFLSREGTARAVFSLADESSGLYISIKHRNSIETWSNDSALSFQNSSLHFDFTRDISQAYGSNMKLINGKAYIYSGDANQDGQIEIEDAAMVNNDAFIYLLGYNSTDLNGDGIVDSSDMVLVEDNAERYVFSLTPNRTRDNSAGRPMR